MKFCLTILMMFAIAQAELNTGSCKEMLQGYLSGQLSSALGAYQVEALRREFKSFTDVMEKSMKVFKEKVNNDIEIAKDARNKSVVYTRWGKKTCPSGAELVLSGYTGGSWFTHSGAAVEPLCLPRDPEWGIYRDGNEVWRGYVYGAEYATVTFSDYMSAITEHDVPCAVCLVRNRSVVKMFPATNDVYDMSVYKILSDKADTPARSPADNDACDIPSDEELENADTTRSPAKKSKKDEVLEKLKQNVKALERPKNILLVGEFGAGKSSFINTAIMALTGKYDYYANVGRGSRNVTTSLCRIPCDVYWNTDDDLKLPTFFDIIGLDPQNSDDKKDTVNSMIMNLIINGNLPPNCDLLDLSKNLYDGRIITERSEDKSLAVDALVVVISAENFNLPHNLMYEIYKEANMKTKKVPVFGVLTKLDKCEQTQKKIENKKIEVSDALSIIPDKLLICSNYDPNDEPDEVKDIIILEFLNKVCNPRIKAVTLQKVEFEPATPVPPDNPPTASNDTSFWMKALQWAFVILVVAFFLSLILEILQKNKYTT